MSRVVLFDELGGPEVLRFAELPTPEPGAGEVRIRVQAIGLNRGEARFRDGGYWYDATLPASRLGGEASGVVEAVGPGVTEVAPGDAVSVLVIGPVMSTQGVYGETVTVPVGSVLRRPADVDPVTGAALWISHLTAYGALVEVAGVRPGGTVVVTAASSSAGLAAVQTARHLGAVPIAVTRSPDVKGDQLRAAGAEHVLAAGDDLADRVRDLTAGRGADVVLDAVGGPGLTALALAVARGGVLVVYGWLDDRPMPMPRNWPLRMYGYAVHLVVEDPEALRRGQDFVLAGLRSGALTPVIDRTFGFDDIAAAHTYLEGNGQVGKIVVTVP
ncbi:zinc-dependent alcohol dehydrogenase family protein [Streptomyces avicenniae]|uniref:zinc-dependent alcohol dehydrogenase family protein n=1 Tax=Streptomyces avicenniae TaxID=500153 RepID=UPI00069C3028|nr:zinc-dependent alcohol dehydrogenase family protein [Streptomyces avicenniae]